MTRFHPPNFSRFLWILFALLFSASMCFRDPCEGKWSDASSFSIRGVDWVDGKVGVLGVFTRRQKCPNILGYTYRTLYSRDVMFFVDPATIHQDENGWWIVEADSVWVIHQEPSIGGGDLWTDPLGRGWWLGGKLYDPQFNQVLDSLPCWEHTYPVEDTLYYLCATETDATPDTVKRRILSTGVDEVLFTYPIVGLLAADAQGRVYITGGSRLLRWEGADSFTVIDSPVVSFGLKGDTLAAEKGDAFYFWAGNNLVDSLPITGHVWSGIAGNCHSTWRWLDDMAITCREADAVFCVTVSSGTGGVLCTTEFTVPRSLLP